MGRPHRDLRLPSSSYLDARQARRLPPVEMTVEKIKSTIGDYVNAAKNAIEAGFDGVEVHGGNGYLPEQFLSSNINKRTDHYGGSEEKRCNFVLELMNELAKAVGQDNLAIRLTPFGLFNQARGEKRLSYVSFVEPRFEQIFSEAEKQQFLGSWGLPTVDLSLFRNIFAGTPFFSAGGFNDVNSWGLLRAVNVMRLRNGWPLQPYDRSTFYGPFEDNAAGYTDYPFYKGE
ncbi:12-oxophytodienoate reductase 2 [Fusarium culmorum]|uniref:12-oxophytodienoate reductase 2 n=1 Tax=Fusarium culmorum TaxID=5516 RepID=A0A2T4H0X5_FUSCU|nr:12-oxophytodienoate reductase 2 [Fusarium culmorum]